MWINSVFIDLLESQRYLHVGLVLVGIIGFINKFANRLEILCYKNASGSYCVSMYIVVIWLWHSEIIDISNIEYLTFQGWTLDTLTSLIHPLMLPALTWIPVWSLNPVIKSTCLTNFYQKSVLTRIFQVNLSLIYFTNLVGYALPDMSWVLETN